VTGDGKAGRIFRNADRTLPAAGLRLADVAGHAGHAGVVERLHAYLVVRGEEMKRGGRATDVVGGSGRAKETQGNAEQGDAEVHEEAWQLSANCTIPRKVTWRNAGDWSSGP